ncbi:unnamed protein product [Leptidea sinapis]|uniref:Uncharacterized protein n=1 Tax=Leptidea sinapis TaxID=189913 RepID=A0A5E4Q737_9NEOP|nr:unnamed protein product [Leptidea sinapis]
MSDNFIPLNQSTPTQNRWNNRSQNHSGYQNNWQQSGNRRRGPQRWQNNTHRNNSFGSDSNSSFGRDQRNSIDAYLHPSMLQDPWAHLRQKE